MSIEELKKAKEVADEKAYKHNRQFEHDRRSKIEAATKLVDAELLPQKQERDRLYIEVSKAKKAVEDELIRLANEGNQHKYPVGSKLQKTQKKWSGYGYQTTSITIYGVLEVVTHETRFPENTSSYNIPSPGSLVVRLCNKDGKPGKKFVKWTEYESSQWKQATEQTNEPNS